MNIIYMPMIRGFKFWLASLVVLASLLVLSGCNESTKYLDETTNYLVNNPADEAKIKQDISSIRSALMVYAQEKGVFPETLAELVPNYLGALPKNPATNQDYEYKMDPLGDYELIYQLGSGERIKATKGADNLPI